MKNIFLSFFFFLFSTVLYAQNNVGIGTNTPHVNAALEIRSNNKGLLMPRLSNTARKNMTTVPKGMIVFDSTYNTIFFHDGSRWLPVSDNNADSLLTDYSSTPEVTANMNGNTNTSARSGLLYDNGGPNGNYGNNRTDEYSILTDASDDSTIGFKIVVESMNLESPYDSLEIYAEEDFANRQVFTGNRTGTFYFINNGGGLYLDFVSNAVNNAAGFRIRWSKLSTSISATTPAPAYGWYFNQKKLAMHGGVNVSNSWATDNMGIRSFSYGLKNNVTGEGAIAFGTGNKATGYNALTVGNNNKAEGPFSIALGLNATAKGIRGNSTAIGFNAAALDENSIAFGSRAMASANDAVAIGTNATASGPGAVVMGTGSVSSGNSASAFGSAVTASADFSAALGTSSSASGVAAIAAGSQVKAIGNFSFAGGDRSESRMIGSVAIGTRAIASGNFAASIGNNTTASGASATAVGQNATASGIASFASGFYTLANGYAATAMGGGTSAGGALSFAVGENSTASGANALAIGTYNSSTGPGAVSIGAVNNSGGNRSVAIGTTLVVNGEYAMALGTKISIPFEAAGSLGIGDLEFSTNTMDNTSIGNPNEFVARFRGGYFFMTSANAPGGNYNNRTGMKMGPGQNSWSAISDVRLKENFEPVDGESILHKISGMPSFTWNYKAQDPKKFRHYGPMAQDFFEAFGKDKYGTIGCDTLINQQDFLGVSFAAIQALEKRTAVYLSEIEILKTQLEALKASNETLLKKLEALKEKK